MRSAAAISHSTFMWMRPWPPDALPGDARLLDAAGDGVADQLLVALAPGAAEIVLRDQAAVVVDSCRR